MKRFCIAWLILACIAPVAGQRGPAGILLFSRALADGTVSLLIEVQASTAPGLTEVRVELPRDAAASAVMLQGPAGWRAARDGNWLRLAGDQTSPPFRVRVTLFELKDAKQLQRARVRIRLGDRDLSDQTLMVTALATLQTAGTTGGLVHVPSVVAPGEPIEMQIFDLARTPRDGQWFVAGVPATPVGMDRLQVRLPDDLRPGDGVRVSYFDVWGERILDVLSVADVVVTDPATAATAAGPRITDCARVGLLGESLCVCGDFPGTSATGITIDGQPATIVASSRHVAHIRLPDTLAPGPHSIGGSAAAGFRPQDTASTRLVKLNASIDVNDLFRGQSTMMRVSLSGATEPMTLRVINRTPGIISIPGGNYQEIELPPDATTVERRVNARSVGNFLIDTRLAELPCPCMEPRDGVSTASRPAPVFVPRRVLAIMAGGTPAATTGAAQALATANGLTLVDVTPIGLTNEALVVFEIVDGLGVLAKVAALAAAPNVALVQPDFVYDTYQGVGSPAAAYGLQMIGADRAAAVATGQGVRVAVVDTGIDSGHTRLQSRLTEFVDLTGSGWTPDLHGTLVAGVIAGERLVEVSGVAPAAVLVGVKACVPHSPTQAAARCWSSTIARGIDAASRMNVRVMNLSVGGQEDRLLTRVVNAAAARGIAMVSAAGNDGPSGKPSYPAAIDNVIAVTAVDTTGALYQRATRGSFIDLAAPGVDIISTGPGGRDRLFSGTSAATAFASGSLALLLQQSKLSVQELRAVLAKSARDLGPAGRDAEFGDGLVDVCRALAAVSRQAIACR